MVIALLRTGRGRHADHRRLSRTLDAAKAIRAGVGVTATRAGTHQNVDGHSSGSLASLTDQMRNAMIEADQARVPEPAPGTLAELRQHLMATTWGRTRRARTRGGHGRGLVARETEAFPCAPDRHRLRRIRQRAAGGSIVKSQRRFHLVDPFSETASFIQPGEAHRGAGLCGRSGVARNSEPSGPVQLIIQRHDAKTAPCCLPPLDVRHVCLWVTDSRLSSVIRRLFSDRRHDLPAQD